MDNKKIVISIILIFMISIFMIFFIGEKKVFKRENNVTNEILEKTDNVLNENTNNKISILNVTEIEEEMLEIQETESEGFKEQGEIAYNGSEKNPNIKLDNYEGLTYYSQIDTRWSNIQYSSIGDKNQTIGTSGCGPACASMIVSSIKGKITPNIMADLYVKNGYRSPSEGTYWSAFKWTSDVFDIEYKETYKLNEAITMLNQGYYIIASCNQGLFTYGGHFIVLVGVENDKIKIYDPYLYNTKFNTSTRKGLAEIQGNTVYVSINDFRNYANYQKFFCFKNDRNDVTENKQQIVYVENLSKTKDTNYKVKITSNIGLNIRTGANTYYSKIGAYLKNTTVTIYAEKNGWGKTKDGWIYLKYTLKENQIQSKIQISNQNKTNYKTGLYKVNCNKLNVRTGPGINYKIKTLNQLTYSARKQGGYVRNVKCTVYQILGEWGKTPSGWICLRYCIFL